MMIDVVNVTRAACYVMRAFQDDAGMTRDHAARAHGSRSRQQRLVFFRRDQLAADGFALDHVLLFCVELQRNFDGLETAVGAAANNPFADDPGLAVVIQAGIVRQVHPAPQRLTATPALGVDPVGVGITRPEAAATTAAASCQRLDRRAPCAGYRENPYDLRSRCWLLKLEAGLPSTGCVRYPSLLLREPLISHRFSFHEFLNSPVFTVSNVQLLASSFQSHSLKYCSNSGWNVRSE